MTEYLKPFISADEVQKHISRIADKLITLQVNAGPDHNQNPLFVTLLDGGRYFSAHLMEEIANHSLGFDPEDVDLPVERDDTGRATFDDHAISGHRVNGRNVIMLDSMLGTGDTAQAAKQHLLDLGANSLSLAVLVEKVGSPRKSNITAEHAGFKIPDTQWVAGSGIADKGISPNAYRWKNGLWTLGSTPDTPGQLALV